MRISRAANIPLLILSVVCTAILIHSTVFYASAAGIGVLNRYTITSAVFLVFFIASLKGTPKYKITALSGISVIGLVFLASEFYLTITARAPGAHSASAHAQGIPFDSRTRSKVMHDLRDSGVDATLVLSALGLRTPNQLNGKSLYPLAGISNRTSVLCNELGEYLIFETDEHGFHNPKNLWDGKPVEIVSIGDSFTHGSCVKSGENTSDILRSTYPNTLNLGLAGSGPLSMLAVLKEYAGIVKPRTVLWFFYEGNDLSELDTELSARPPLRRYLEPGYSQNLIDKQAQIDAELDELIDSAVVVQQHEPWSIKSLFSRIKLHTLRGRISEKVARPWRDPCHVREEILEYFGSILSEAKNFTETWGGDLYFVYLPEQSRWGHDPNNCVTKGPPSEHQYRRFERILEKATDVNIPIIDITLAFNEYPDPLSLFAFRQDGHYNPDGYRFVAETILEALNKKTD